ncbi:hypothetical protein FB451DRAFT_290762 [Mycena latifolia]|nr:hypothetical protein FB451DRAFT_290762 [Mycena latifolia]
MLCATGISLSLHDSLGRASAARALRPPVSVVVHLGFPPASSRLLTWIFTVTESCEGVHRRGRDWSSMQRGAADELHVQGLRVGGYGCSIGRRVVGVRVSREDVLRATGIFPIPVPFAGWECATCALRAPVPAGDRPWLSACCQSLNFTVTETRGWLVRTDSVQPAARGKYREYGPRFHSNDAILRAMCAFRPD